jgi:uncharacterized protein (TIGR02466 family)
MNDYSVFPTLIIKDNILTKKECKYVVSVLKDYSRILKKHECFKGESLSGHDPNINLLKEPKLRHLQGPIRKRAQQFGEKAGLKFRNEIAISWFNIQKPGSILQEHAHPNAILAGVLFLEVDKDSSPIYFYNPNPYIQWMLRQTRNNQYYGDHVSFQPKAGDLILFNGWLKHGSNLISNKSSKRTVLSFNIV